MKKILTFITLVVSVAGPSIITTMAGNDGGGVITYSLAGAQFGYGLLILLPFLTLVYGLTQEVGSRLAIVTGRGMGDLIRERYGVRASVLMFALFFVANIGTLITNAAAVKASLQLFGLSQGWVALILAILVGGVFYMVTKFNYQTNQKIFLASMFLYIAYVISAVNSRPDWGRALTALVIPTPQSLTPSALIASIAFVGTTITPWGQFFIQSYMKDKKLPLEHLHLSSIESYLGAFVSNLTTFFIIVATTTALYDTGTILESGEQAALAIKPFAGEFASALFGAGLLNAGVIGMIIVGLSTSYAFTEFFGFEGTLDVGYAQGKNFYKLFLFQTALATVIVLVPSISAFRIATVTQSFNGIILPLLFYFLIKAASDRGIMREYALGRPKQILLMVFGTLIVLASLFSIVYSLIA